MCMCVRMHGHGRCVSVRVPPCTVHATGHDARGARHAHMLSAQLFHTGYASNELLQLLRALAS
eukprot:5175349-Alexandrium_andersonii.AAC.1